MLINSKETLAEFISVSKHFPSIQPDFARAERDHVLAFIGAEAFALIDVDTPTGQWLTAKKLAQEMAVFFAMADNAASWRLDITGHGITVTSNADAKVAQGYHVADAVEEWRGKAYKAKGLLLAHLEANKATLTEWTSSDERKAELGIVIPDADTFARYRSIERGRATYELMRPYIKKAELELVKPALGATLYDALLAKLKTAATLTEQEADLLDYIRPVAAYRAVEEALYELPFEIGISGLVVSLRANDETRQRRTADSQQAERHRIEAGNKAKGAHDALIVFLNGAASDYPDFQAESKFYKPGDETPSASPHEWNPNPSDESRSFFTA